MPKPRPSRTATKIARFMVMVDSIPRLHPLLPSGAAETIEAVMLASGAVRPSHLAMMKRPLTHRFMTWSERLTRPGQVAWFGVRKRWMAEQMESAIQQGATQLLVVGAGFDPLASLIARRHPQVLCVEVDAAPTAEPKQRGVEGAGLARDNHRICAADLSATALGTVLGGTRWHTGSRSVVVAEGLLMYLRPAAVEAFFSSVRDCTGPGSRLAFSSLDADAQGRPRLGAMDKPIRLLLKLAGEPMHWGLAPAAAPAFLRGAGYRVLEQPTPQSLRRSLLEPLGLGEEPLSPYEHLVLAEVAGG